MKNYRGVTPRGRHGIQIDYRFKGQRVRETIPLSHTAENLKRAHKLRESRIWEIQIGTYKHVKKQSYTLAESLQAWLNESETSWKINTQETYRKYVRFWLEESGIGTEQLSDLSGARLHEVLCCFDQGGKYKNELMAVVAKSAELAFRRGFIADFEFENMPKFKASPVAPNPFGLKELPVLLEGLPDSFRHYFGILAYTGMRPGELCALKLSDISTEGEAVIFNISGTLTKGGVIQSSAKTSAGERSIKLEPEAISYFAVAHEFANCKGSEYLIHSNGVRIKSYSHITGRHGWRETLERMNIDHRPHYQLRHTFASHRISSGWPPVKLAAYLGHKDWSITARKYARWVE